MRVLITGGTGTIGREVLKKLSNSVDVTLIARNASQIVEPCYRTVTFSDVNKKNVLFEEKFDLLIHLAYDPFSWKNNLYMAKVLIDLTKKNSISKFVMASSVDVYGKQKRGCVSSLINSERPNSCYGKQKLELETLFKNTISKDTSLVLLRIGLVLGKNTWWDDFFFNSTLCNKLYLPNGGSNIVNYIYKEELSEIIVGFIGTENLNSVSIVNLGMSTTFACLYLKFNPNIAIFDDIGHLHYKEKLKLLLFSNCLLLNAINRVKKNSNSSNNITKVEDKKCFDSIYPARNANVYYIHHSSIDFGC